MERQRDLDAAARVAAERQAVADSSARAARVAQAAAEGEVQQLRRRVWELETGLESCEKGGVRGKVWRGPDEDARSPAGCAPAGVRSAQFAESGQQPAVESGSDGGGRLHAGPLNSAEVTEEEVSFLISKKILCSSANYSLPGMVQGIGPRLQGFNNAESYNFFLLAAAVPYSLFQT
jgi:hypothetical protein